MEKYNQSSWPATWWFSCQFGAAVQRLSLWVIFCRLLAWLGTLSLFVAFVWLGGCLAKGIKCLSHQADMQHKLYILAGRVCGL